MNKVSFYKVPEYDFDQVLLAVEKIFDDFGGLEKMLDGKKKVVIKPNLVMKKDPKACATTHPVILDAVLTAVEKYDVEIVCAECSGGPNTPVLMKSIYKETGLLSVLNKHNVPYVSDMVPVEVSVPGHLSCPKIDILKEFVEADVIISLAKMKTHSLTVQSGAAKNLYGVIPGLRKIEYHARFPKISDFAGLILDINKVIVPDITIIDGIFGMEKDGPTGGIPKFAGALLGSDNVFALDMACADFMGIDPDIIPILVRAKNEGLVPEFEITGDDFKNSKPTPFILPDSRKKQPLNILPDIFGGRLNKFLSPRPKVLREKCRGCGECARLCPQKTITVISGTAKMNYKNCIRCWCCQEMCPHGAIIAKGRFFLHK